MFQPRLRCNACDFSLPFDFHCRSRQFSTMDNHQMIKNTHWDFKSSTPLPKRALAWLNRINPQCGPTTQERRCWWSPRIPTDTRLLWSSRILSKRRSRVLVLLAWHRPAPLSLCVSGGGRYTLPRLALVWVVEGKRQLEIGANVECEELGCVVGGPFKPNKHREVRGLVWRPWINKPSGMTMRCADISHHTALSSKHTPPRTPLLCPMCLLTSPLLSSLHRYFIFCVAFFFLSSHLHFVPFRLPLFFNSSFLHSQGLHPPASRLPSDFNHPSLCSPMHAWLGVCPWPCLRYRPRYGTALALSRHTTAETPRVQAHKVYLSRGEAVRLLTTAFLLLFPFAGNTENWSHKQNTSVFKICRKRQKFVFRYRKSNKKLWLKAYPISAVSPQSPQLFTIGGF